MDSCNTNKNRDEIYNESDEKKDNVDLNENNNADGVNSSDANQEADNVDMSVNDHKEKKNLLHINDILIFILSGLLVAFAFMFSDYPKKRAEINKENDLSWKKLNMFQINCYRLNIGVQSMKKNNVICQNHMN